MTIENKATEITPKDLKTKLDAGENIILLDVREPHELLIAAIQTPNNIHIRMPELSQRISELENYKDTDLVVYCRSGGRSGRCTELLRLQGFKKAINLTGGILS